MKATINFIQTMTVDCISCHEAESSAWLGYDESSDAYSITCVGGVDRCYWLVMNRRQHEAYADKLKQLRDITKE